MTSAPFIVQPLGGLANRMRVVAKCYEIAQAAGVQMQVNWISDGDCGAYWHDLFVLPDFPIMDNGASRQVVWMSRKWYHRLPVLIYKLKNRINVMLTAPTTDILIDEDEQHPEKFCHKVEQWLRQGKRIFLSTGSFLGNPADLSMFQPIAVLQRQIDNFFNTHIHDANLSSHLYGVHIRRTDNTWSIESSPLELFVHTIQSVIDTDSAAVFFLATDDQPTIETLKEKFGSRIIVRDKEFSRLSAKGIQDALIDMWLLSKTQHIYGSFFSSFSEMASWIGGIPLTVLNSVSHLNFATYN